MFGGLYLNYLRHALYKNIIDVENLINKAIHKGKGWVEFARLDFDADGSEEIILENNSIFALIAPSRGGSMDIFEFRPKSFSLTNTLTRRKEAYHHKLEMAQNGNNSEGQPASIHDIIRVKEDNLTDYLIYDQVDRHCFQDRFLDHNVGIDDYRAQQFNDHGDFVIGPYLVSRLDKNNGKGRKAGSVEVAMAREGHVESGNANNAVTVNKSYGLIGDNGAISVTYEIINQGASVLSSRFAVEFNLTMLAGDAEDRYWIGCAAEGRPRLKEIIEDDKVDMIGMQDDWSRMAVIVKSDKVFDSWRFPVETVSQSESGFERTYQGSCMALLWDIDLGPDESTKFTVTLGVEEV
jgi:alpha-amylase